MAERIELSEEQADELDSLLDVGCCKRYLSEDIRTCRSLVNLGLVAEPKRCVFVITALGRAWLKGHGHG